MGYLSLKISEINMIEMDTDYGDDGHRHSVLKIQADARAMMLSEGDIIHSTPLKMPMDWT